MKLSEKAMLITLSISTWTARKHDKAATREVAANHNASTDVGRYNKQLIRKTSIETIQKIAGEIRSNFYRISLPWNDSGSRILPAALFDQFRTDLNKGKNQFDWSVREFLAAYPALIQDARYRLNGLFNQADYPNLDVIARKFSVTTQINPLPDAEDFRVSLQNNDVTAIRQEIQAQTQATTNRITKDCFTRLYEALKHISDRLGTEEATDKKPIFRDSLIDNLKELLPILPSLNLADDPELEALTLEAKQLFRNTYPDTLRQSVTARVEAKTQADTLLSKMANYFQPDEEQETNDAL